MFTYIKLKNFMSFKDTMFDFKNGSKNIKKFISIYGENGSGKSNFVIGIDFLRKSVDSLDNYSKTLFKYSKELVDIFQSFLNINEYRKKCRMIECDEPTTIEYGFRVNGHEGYYIISFDERFMYEKLYYFTGKQRGVLYEIDYANSKLNIEFSNRLFKNKKIEAEIKEEINKYWGKHTLLSIFNRDREEKNEEYIKENYLTYLYDIIDMLEDTTIHCETNSLLESDVGVEKPVNILTDLEYGKIKKNNEKLLNKTERIIRNFFTQAYADIKDIYYEKRIEGEELVYELFVKKMIGEKIRTIKFSRESAGTRHILDIIHSLLGVFCGVTVVYDEIDNGIHDLLLKNILESMIEDITGQLIITTHNTYLLETIDIKSVYLITVDYLGNKDAKCLDKYPRIQNTNNPRIMYLKGLFGGIPIVDTLDYDTILNELTESSDEEGGKK